MRKLFVTAAAVAALLSTGALTARSDAMTLAAPTGLHKAVKTIKTGKSVVKARWVCHRHGWGRHDRHGRCFWVHGRHGR